MSYPVHNMMLCYIFYKTWIVSYLPHYEMFCHIFHKRWILSYIEQHAWCCVISSTRHDFVSYPNIKCVVSSKRYNVLSYLAQHMMLCNNFHKTSIVSYLVQNMKKYHILGENMMLCQILYKTGCFVISPTNDELHKTWRCFISFTKREQD